ncbi:MAG: hypothetical protein ACI9ON_002526 [Limisphaerales bacterium]|jgi:hypothetical protein
MSETWLLWGLIFGSIGLGYVIYGRKQKNTVVFLSGLALMVFPYFVSGTLALVGVGILLICVPFVIKQ